MSTTTESGIVTEVDLSVDLGRGLVLANPLSVTSGRPLRLRRRVRRRGCRTWIDSARSSPRARRSTRASAIRHGAWSPPDAQLDAPAGPQASRRSSIHRSLGVVDLPVIHHVHSKSVDDYVAVARALNGHPGVAGIEFDISCPNVGAGGLQFALDAGAAGEVTAAVRRATELPLIVKVSPAATDVRGIAKAIADGGADAISAVNTLPAWHSTGTGASRCWATSTAACRVRRSSRSRCESCTRSPRWSSCRSWR